MASTNWTEGSGWTNPVNMKCPKCKTVWKVGGKDAAKGGVGCKKPSCRGEALHR